MLTAITRAVSPAIVDCELSFIDRQPIDLVTAQEQHHAYEKLLGRLGARVISLPAEPDLPEVIAVPVNGCLHLKSALTHLGGNQLLANRAWFDTTALAGHEWIDVDPAEPHAANALALAGTIIFPASFPRTRARIEACGLHVTPVDISELQKAESGLTCSSLIFTNTSSVSL
ncbi:MAG: hypothetical protein DMG54_17515 [Acidobacteria bacterium]|nr:MAG: hypothetical protein DMG54_17515 [Acidobacteriota bacterium]